MDLPKPSILSRGAVCRRSPLVARVMRLEAGNQLVPGRVVRRVEVLLAPVAVRADAAGSALARNLGERPAPAGWPGLGVLFLDAAHDPPRFDRSVTTIVNSSTAISRQNTPH